MRRGRIIIGIITGTLALVLSATALAASPGEIAEDLKDGRLDGSYSQADLQAYLQSAVAQGYGNPVVTPVAASPVTPVNTAVPPASGVAGVATSATPATTPATGVAGVSTPVTGVAGVSTPATKVKRAAPVKGVAGVQTAPSQQPLAATQQVGTLPFTGLDLALLTIGGTLLLLLGLGARRAGRTRA